MTESMIERVRDAIFKEMDVSDGLDLPAAQRYARAAIEAMREPTDLMIEAGLGVKVRDHKTMQDVLDYDNEGGALEIVFPAMIDAALQWPAGSADRAGVPLAKD